MNWLFCLYLLIVVCPLCGEAATNCPAEPIIESAELQRSPFFTLRDSVLETLENQKQIQISILNIANQAGVLQQSAGPFDINLNQTSKATAARAYQRPPQFRYAKQDYDVQTSLTKTTRMGTTFTFFNEEEYTVDHIPNTLRFRESMVAFTINQPLLNNFMYGLNTQIEKANRLELIAVEWDTLFAISQTILNTVTQYWNVVGAKLNLDVQKEAEIRLNHLLETSKNLVQGSILAPSDLNQILVSITNQQAATAEAEVALYVNDQNLRFAMGEIDEDGICAYDTLVNVINAFPRIPECEVILKKTSCLINTGFNYRADLLAAITREFEAQTLLKGAWNQTLPGLNVFGTVSRSDNRQAGGSLSSPPPSYSYFREGETDWTVGLNISVPFYNDAALGFLRQQEAQTAQAGLEIQLLKQNIITNILQTVHTLVALKQEIQFTQESVDYYKVLIRDESARLQAGFGNIFVLLNFENLLTATTSSLVSFIQQYFQNIALLKFNTGTLVNIDSKTKTILYYEDIKFPFE